MKAALADSNRFLQFDQLQFLFIASERNSSVSSFKKDRVTAALPESHSSQHNGLNSIERQTQNEYN